MPCDPRVFVLPSGSLCWLCERHQAAQDGRGAAQPRLWIFPIVEEYNFHVGPYAGRRALLADERHEAVRIGKDIVAERYHRAFRSGLDLLHVGLAAKRFDRNDLQQVLDFLGQRPKTIDQLGSKRLDLALILDFGKAAIKPKTHRQVGHVILGDHHRRPDGDLRRPLICDWRSDASLETRDRLLEHLLIELEANLLDVTGLLFPQEIAGSADIEVMRGKLETGAKRIERLQHRQPTLRLRRDLAHGG